MAIRCRSNGSLGDAHAASHVFLGQNVAWRSHHSIEFFESDETRRRLVLALFNHPLKISFLKQAAGGAHVRARVHAPILLTSSGLATTPFPVIVESTGYAWSHCPQHMHKYARSLSELPLGLR